MIVFIKYTEKVQKVVDIYTESVYYKIRKRKETGMEIKGEKTMTRIFFSSNGAKRFMMELEEQGFDDIQMWMDKDAFGQTIYIVKWY